MEILNHPLITQRYFFPLEAPLDDATWVRVPGASLACWRSAPPSERPVLVHFHGNGELVHDWADDFTDAVQDMGWEVFLAEYRGYGASTGTPRLGELLDDVPHIAAAVGVPQERLVVFGRSVGSLFAVEWARRFPDVRGLVLESGIHDVHERLALRVTPQELGLDADAFAAAVRARIDHDATLRAYPGPCLLLHADHDHLVEPYHAERNAAACGERATLVRLPRGGHNSILASNRAAYFGALKRFLGQLA